MCRTSSIATARTCVRHLPGNLLAASSTNTLLRDGTWKYALRQPVQRLSSTFTRSDLRQHNFQRFQRRRRVQLWPGVCLVCLRDPTRAHVGLPWLPLVSLRPSCPDGCPPIVSRTSLWALLCTSCDKAQGQPIHLWCRPNAILAASSSLTNSDLDRHPENLH